MGWRSFRCGRGTGIIVQPSRPRLLKASLPIREPNHKNLAEAQTAFALRSTLLNSTSMRVIWFRARWISPSIIEKEVNDMPTMTTPEKITVPQPTAKIPPLTWVTGKIEQILLQDKEHFYVVTVNDGKKTVICMFGDPYTGKTDVLTMDNPVYAL